MNIKPLSQNQLFYLSSGEMPLNQVMLQLQAHSIALQKGFDRLLCLNNIYIEPQKYQFEAALKVLKDMQGSAILADEVGLGKTIEAGIILKELLYRGIAKTALILTPAPLVEQWKSELSEKFEIEPCEIDNEGWESAPVIISSMPKFSRSKERQDILYKRFFDLIIIDEAHCLKNHNTVTYKTTYKLQKKNALLLSATPIQNDLRELYNLVNILKPGYLESRKKFVKNYVEDRFTPKNIRMLKKLLNEVMIRNRRSNTLTTLPSRNVQSIDVELSDLEYKFYNGVIDFCRKIYWKYYNGQIRIGWDKESVNKLALLLIMLLKENTSCPQAAISTLRTKVLPKVREISKDDYELGLQLLEIGEAIRVPTKLKQLVNRIKDCKEKIIIYTEYKQTMRLIEGYLKKMGFSTTTFHGELSSKEKQVSIAKFKDNAQIFISTEAGGQGLNLQFCHILYNYDLPWNPMKIEQRIGRVHRHGQSSEVNIYSFITKGTIEEYLLHILTSKLNLFQSIIGQIDSVLSYMKNQKALDIRIGYIVLESPTVKDIELKMRELGEEIRKASEEFNRDLESSELVINKIGL